MLNAFRFVLCLMAVCAVKEELYAVIESKGLHDCVANGTFRYVDAAHLVLRVLEDFDSTVAQYKTRIKKCPWFSSCFFSNLIF